MNKVIISIIAVCMCLMAVYGVVRAPSEIGGNVRQTPVQSAEYHFPWPGILPDQGVLYKLKVMRNKIILNILYSTTKKVEFELLMTDKTLYASKLLMEKGKTELAKETALKGENYFSMLVSDYAKIVSEAPESLDRKIDDAYRAHQGLIGYLHRIAPEPDKSTFTDIDYFSDTNYQIIQNIRKENNH